MNLGAVLLAPLMFLISAVDGRDAQPAAQLPDDGAANAASAVLPQETPVWPIGVVRSFQPDVAWQMRIEQRMTIRIAPRAAMPVPRDMFTSIPGHAGGIRFSERKIGKCLPITGIVGVEPDGPSKLILFMRDRRMIGAELERSCLARSFYSGFYLARSIDGNICVNRDTLLSRSGTACKLSRIRQLIEDDE